MANGSSIEWTESTWNPVTGCTKVSPGCAHCYAERMALSPINSGHARRRPARRGRCTFVPYRLWIESGWSSEADGLGIPPRTYSQRPAELTVAGEAKEVMNCVIEVHRLEPGEAFRP